MQSCAGWSRRNPELLEQELQQLFAAFPTFIATLGLPLDDDRCWVEAAEPCPCPQCAELVVFDHGPRCVACGTAMDPPSSAVIGLIGRIPALISGRPFARDLEQRMALLQKAEPQQYERFSRSLLVVQGKQYLAPRFGIWFAQSWPHADPPVMVWSEYFQQLNIPPDHVYYADQYYRLCLYASWREQPAVRVLQNRIVPRLLIDLMVADLQAVGRLDQALDQLDATLYELYNTVGHPDLARPLQQVYDEHMRSSSPR